MTQESVQGQIAAPKPTSVDVVFAPRVRKSPYHRSTLRCGATGFSIYNHMFLPMAYSREPGRDYFNAVRRVQLWDVACERQVEISGPDALRFAQLLTPRDLSRIQVGQAAYTLITNPEGGILNDPLFLKLAEDRCWFSLSDNDILLWARGLAQSGDYEVSLREPDVSPLQVQGPCSEALLSGLFGDWVRGLPFYRFREFDFDGIPLLVGRMGYSHLPCFELFLRDARLGEALWERLWHAGKPLGISAGAPIAALRLEAGIFSYGTDIDERTNPYELGLGWMVALESGHDFIGREALLKASAHPPARLVLGAEIAGAPIWSGNEDHWPVFWDGRRAGVMTSCAYSPGLDKNLAYVMLDAEYADLGSALEVAHPEGACAATVVGLPWIERMA